MSSCTCPDWQSQFPDLTAVYSPTPAFRFCPWCGRPLTAKTQRNEKLLAQCHQSIQDSFAVTDEWGTPDTPNMFIAARPIADYRERTHDIQGALELMLTFIESGNWYTNSYGDIDEPFYEGLELMLDDFRDLLLAYPDLYNAPKLPQRVAQLVRQAGEIGWGYGDYVREVVEKIQNHFGDI